MQIVDSAKLTAAKRSVDFTADVVSEDDGDKVRFQLYIDYGFTNEANQPFRYSIDNFTPLEPSTMSDMNRTPATARWFPGSNPVDFGCHTVTLIASHAFDDSSACPVCRNDSSQLTWQVFRCDSSSTDHPCDDPDFGACNDWSDRCNDVANPDAGTVCGAAP